ncbi:MAG: hypothetical protein ACYCXQ_13685 [Candidatus Humimicrobiaceae bacterium]
MNVLAIEFEALYFNLQPANRNCEVIKIFLKVLAGRIAINE